MKKIAFFDTKPYDKESFDKLNNGRYEIKYFETRLTAAALPLADGCDAACAFVNAEIDRAVVEGLVKRGIKVLAMRCAGYNNVDFKAAYEAGLTVVRVPAYSPYAVAEHAAALLLSLNRHIHTAAARTRDFNFSLAGLTGFDLHGKTVGVIGTGKIGRIFADICKGFGMRVLAYDAFPNPTSGLEYVTLDKLLAESDVVSLHCPLLPDTKHLINADTLARRSAASRSSTRRAADLSIRRRCWRRCAAERSEARGLTSMKRKANGSTRIVLMWRARTRRSRCLSRCRT